MARDLKKGASENAHIVFIDEAGLMMDPLRRRGYAPRGDRPILTQLFGPRKKVSIIAGLSISPCNRHPNLYFQTLPDGSFRSANVADFLRDLLKHLRGRVIVVWDNGPMHKGQAMRDLLRDYPRLSIEHLPAYSPEFNPVEQLWSHLKYGHCANLIPESLDHLENDAIDFLIDTKYNGKLLQSYWEQTPLIDSMRNESP